MISRFEPEIHPLDDRVMIDDEDRDLLHHAVILIYPNGQSVAEEMGDKWIHAKKVIVERMKLPTNHRRIAFRDGNPFNLKRSNIITQFADTFRERQQRWPQLQQPADNVRRPTEQNK